MMHFCTRLLTRYLLTCSCVMIMANTYAASADDGEKAGESATDKPQPQGEDAVKAPPQNAGRKITTKDGDEIFLPSEEISEDFAVSFPVDI